MSESKRKHARQKGKQPAPPVISPSPAVVEAEEKNPKFRFHTLGFAEVALGRRGRNSIQQQQQRKTFFDSLGGRSQITQGGGGGGGGGREPPITNHELLPGLSLPKWDLLCAPFYNKTAGEERAALADKPPDRDKQPPAAVVLPPLGRY